MSDPKTECGTILRIELTTAQVIALERMKVTGFYGASLSTIAFTLLGHAIRRVVRDELGVMEGLSPRPEPPPHVEGAPVSRPIPAMDGYTHGRQTTLADGTRIWEGSMDQESWIELHRETPSERGF